MGGGGEAAEGDLQHCCIQHLLRAGGWGVCCMNTDSTIFLHA